MSGCNFNFSLLAQVRELREHAALVEAHNARLTASAQAGQLERSYLVAERQLMVAQLRHMAVLLASDAGECEALADDTADAGKPGEGNGSSPAASASFKKASYHEVKAAQQKVAAVWEHLPVHSSLRVLGAPSELSRDMDMLNYEMQQVRQRQQQQLAEAQQHLEEAGRQLDRVQDRCRV